MARKRGPGGVWAARWCEGVGGRGHALAAFKYSLNTQKMQPGVGSGEGGGVVWAVRARGGVGTHWQPFKYPLNT